MFKSVICFTLSSTFIYCLNNCTYASMQSIFLLEWLNTCKLDHVIWLFKNESLKLLFKGKYRSVWMMGINALFTCSSCQSEFILFFNQNKFGSWKSEHSSIFVYLIQKYNGLMKYSLQACPSHFLFQNQDNHD